MVLPFDANLHIRCFKGKESREFWITRITSPAGWRVDTRVVTLSPEVVLEQNAAIEKEAQRLVDEEGFYRTRGDDGIQITMKLPKA